MQLYAESRIASFPAGKLGALCPYANGPLHLGHVAGNSLPADIQYKYERAMGRRVLMLSGSDEHGTPITVTAEEAGISPQDVVDEFHNVNSKALTDSKYLRIIKAS